MKAITVYKIMECQRTIWENNLPTDQKEPRTLVVFKRETSALGGLKTVVQFGSLLLNRGITVEQATNSLTKDDYSEEVEFLAVEDSNFYKVQLL